MIEGHLEEYRPRALIFACGICDGNLDDAGDLVQDASIRAWQGWPPPDQSNGFWPWFERIILNCWINKCKSMVDGPWIPRYRDEEDEDMVPELVSLDALIEAGWDIADPGSDPAVIYEQKETQIEGLARVNELPPMQSKCIRMALCGLDYHEIAEDLDISYEAVRQNVSRGRKKLEQKTTAAQTGGDGAIPGRSGAA